MEVQPGFTVRGGWVDEAQLLPSRQLTHDEDGNLLGGFRLPTEVKYDASLLAAQLRLTATERLAVGLDLPLDLIEDQSHITRGEN